MIQFARLASRRACQTGRPERVTDYHRLKVISYLAKITVALTKSLTRLHGYFFDNRQGYIERLRLVLQFLKFLRGFLNFAIQFGFSCR